MWDGGTCDVGLSLCFGAWAPWRDEMQFLLLQRKILIHPKSTDNIIG